MKVVHGNRGQQPPQGQPDPNMQVKVALKDTSDVACEQCDHKLFTQLMMFKNLSAVMSPTGEESLIPIINFIQKYYSLDKTIHYKLLSDILPKQKLFSKYIKGKKMDKYNPELVTIVSKHYEISKREAKLYIDLFRDTTDGTNSLTGVLELYGNTQKEIKKLLK